jgi:hypothetical protein
VFRIDDYPTGVRPVVKDRFKKFSTVLIDTYIPPFNRYSQNLVDAVVRLGIKRITTGGVNNEY